MCAKWAAEPWVDDVISTLKRSVVIGSTEECPVVKVLVSQMYDTSQISIVVVFRSTHGEIELRTNQSVNATIDNLVEDVLQACAQCLNIVNKNGSNSSPRHYSLQDTDDDPDWLKQHKNIYGD